MDNKNNAINYVEFPLLKNAETKLFYSQAFGWEFTDWGLNYLSFSGAGVNGGFNGEGGAGVTTPGVLVVLYASDLLEKYQEVESAGAEITKPIYGFPGGERFHFLDPNGNELAVWSE
ncbi:MAG: VOC family protein [Rhodospirillales bacterium]|nr:VOC family protein [Rhodospirillales bacterium]